MSYCRPVGMAPVPCGQFKGKRRKDVRVSSKFPLLASQCSGHVWHCLHSTGFTLVWIKASSTSFNRFAQTEGLGGEAMLVNGDF